MRPSNIRETRSAFRLYLRSDARRKGRRLVNASDGYCNLSIRLAAVTSRRVALSPSLGQLTWPASSFLSTVRDSLRIYIKYASTYIRI